MLRIALALCALLLACQGVTAQVIYSPVEFQHRAGTLFYYAGSDPGVLSRASHPMTSGRTFGRVNGWAFASGSIHTHREVACEPTRIYTDAIPNQNARIYGYTVADVQNEAYRAVPRYFRKSELLKDAVVRADGAIEVPAVPRGRSGTIEIMPMHRNALEIDGVRRSGWRRSPQPLMIFPKQLLEKQPPASVVLAD